MRTLFRFNIQSYSDIITNSSSELFVFKNNSVEEVINILNTIYPDWRSEYQEPILFKNMSKEDQDRYIEWVADCYRWFGDYDYYYNGISWIKRTKKEQIEVFEHDVIEHYHKKFDVDNKDVPSLFENWGDYNNEYFYLRLSTVGYDIFRKKFENDIALWSLDENPNWDYQQEIEEYAERYHLG